MSRRIAYVDAGTVGSNPGPAGIGVVMFEDGRLVDEVWEPIGWKSSNEAEWGAVVVALQVADGLGWDGFGLRSDSKLIVDQFNGKAATRKRELQDLRDVAMDHAAGKSISAKWIPREENTRANNLAQRGAEESARRVETPLARPSVECVA
jgi:ribonuclease HI